MYSGQPWRILVGCAPCQPFSIYTGRYRRGVEQQAEDQRWQLLEEFARLVEELRPDIVSMENVPRVALHPVFKAFVERLTAAGYHVNFKKVRAEDYGVPQKRARLVLFASIFGSVQMVPPTHRAQPRTVRDAIGKLPPIAAGQTSEDDHVHFCRNLSEKNLRRLQATPEGGSWKNWDTDLILDCHKKPGGVSFRSVYGRMRWDEPSPVITTQCLGIGNGRFGHPEQDRAISIREAALLQSFPPSFELIPADEPANGNRLARQIGNAVPVNLAKAVARSIREHLNKQQAAA
jgi:DNA (cytosine-5)-methyltransferase 1